MQTNRLPVCNMGLFDDANHFWVGPIQRLVSRYPHLALPHVNTFYTFLILESGRGKVVLDQNSLAVEDKQVLIIKPNCITTLELDQDANGRMICFSETFFSLRYNQNMLHQFSFFKTEKATLISLTDEVLKCLTALGAYMDLEFKNRTKASKNALRSYLNIILIELERMYEPAQKLEVVDATRDKVSRFQNLIDAHYKSIKTPSEYAELLHISTNYLNKICKKTLGVTSSELIRKQILLEAQRFLHYTNLSVTEIAHELGFDHASYFVTLFKKGTDQTPEQYRKNKI